MHYQSALTAEWKKLAQADDARRALVLRLRLEAELCHLAAQAAHTIERLLAGEGARASLQFLIADKILSWFLPGWGQPC